MDQYESFKNIIATSDEQTKARFGALADQVVATAARELGVTITREDAIAVHSLRIAALSPGYDMVEETYLRELKTLPAVQTALRNAELRKALEAGSQEALERLGSDPAARMTRARELGLTGSTKPEAKTPTAEEERAGLTVIASLGNPAARIAYARKIGLVK